MNCKITLNNFFIIIIICLGSCATTMQAQMVVDSKNKIVNDSILDAITDIDERIKEFSHKKIRGGLLIDHERDSLLDLQHLLPNISRARRDGKGLIIFPYQPKQLDETLTFRDTMILEPSYLPVIFEGKLLPDNLDFRSKEPIFGKPQSFHLISPDSTFAPQLAHIRQVEEKRKLYYTQHLTRVNISALNFSDSPVIREQVLEKKGAFKELLSTKEEIVGLSTLDVTTVKIKRAKWKKTGVHKLLVSQNQLSDNWNGTGGENRFNVENYHKIDFNFKRNKFTLNNTVEWQLNFMRTPADTIHSISMNQDLFRVYSVLGMEAFKKWSYSFKLEAKTPLFNSYPINSANKRTALLSPLIVNVGVGMSFNLTNVSKTDKHRNIKLSLDLSPISINYTYVGDEKVNETRFGIEKGDKAKTDFGSTVNSVLTWNLNRYTTFYNRTKYFSNYEKAQIECDNRFSFAINQYFSTSINLYLRFDDAIGVVNKDDKLGYFQYNQVLGFGLEYKW